MDPEFWHARWTEGRTGFHLPEPHPDLLAWRERFLGGGPHRVLVPLCGKSQDLAWLEQAGHEVIGVELSPLAIDAVFAGRQPEVDRLGPFERRRAGRLTCLVGDAFDLCPAGVGPVDRIWDRAALVALDPPRRARYARVLRGLLQPGGLLLQSTFTYDQHKMDGPPFSVPDDELLQHYEGWTAERLSAVEEGLDARFGERGLSSWLASIWLLRRPDGVAEPPPATEGCP